MFITMIGLGFLVELSVFSVFDGSVISFDCLFYCFVHITVCCCANAAAAVVVAMLLVLLLLLLLL